MATIDRTSSTALLFNPRTYDASEFDEPTRRALLATIEFFESRGKRKLKDDDHERVWYADFLEFVHRERIFASFLTPAADAGGDPGKRWDTARIFAFGLSEKEHGADIYSTDMVLTPTGDGGFSATGGKYYIGNGNKAGMVSVFGRRADVEGADGYVFFAADSQHPSYELVKNVVNSQNYVSHFE